MDRLIHELTRVLAVLVTAPLWYPVVKALWQEANKALARDGGVLGAIPDARALRELDREERFAEPSMVSVPRDSRRAAALDAQAKQAERAKERDGGAARGKGRAAARRGTPRRAGFR